MSNKKKKIITMAPDFKNRAKEMKKTKLEMVKAEEAKIEYVWEDLKIMDLGHKGAMVYSKSAKGGYLYIPKDKIASFARHLQTEHRDPETLAITHQAGNFLIVLYVGTEPSHFFFADYKDKRDLAFKQAVEWFTYRPNILNTLRRFFQWLTGIGSEKKPVEIWTKIRVPVKKSEPVQ